MRAGFGRVSVRDWLGAVGRYTVARYSVRGGCPVPCGGRFRRRALALVFLSLGAVPVAPALGGLRFESRVIEDTVSPDAKSYPFTFAFENTGDEPVEIREIKTSCGCTTAELEKKVYAPGESGVIEGSFSIGNRQGKQQKTIRVLTKDVGQPEIGLALKLEIPQLVTMKPGLLLWRVGSEPAPKTLRVVPNADLGVSVLDVGTDSADFAVETVGPEEGASGREVVVVPLKTDASGRGLIKVRVGREGGKPKSVYAHALIR